MTRIACIVAIAVAALSLAGCLVYRAEPTASDGEAARDRARERESPGAVPALGPATPVGVEAPAGPPRSDDEVCAVRQAIVAALRASAEPWASSLAGRTDGAPCALEPDGTARIGGWSLRACVEGCESLTSMRFVWREEGVQTPSYAAEVVREGAAGFRCAMLGQYLVR